MTTRLDKTLKRELEIKGQAFVVTISPEGLKLTLKGHRKGFELQWESLVSGDAALSIALNASVGQFTTAEISATRPVKGRARQKAKAIRTAK